MSQPAAPQVVELRRYTLHPGARDTLIELFEREFVESQEVLGITLPAAFRDLGADDQFVWVRGFADLPARPDVLGAFYSGPAWQTHRDAANATMIDSDNVLLLRPVTPDSGFAATDRPRPPVGATQIPPTVVEVTVYHHDGPVTDEFVRLYLDQAQPALDSLGAPAIACLRTEEAENNFPVLPVRADAAVLVVFARFTDRDAHAEHSAALRASTLWNETVLPKLTTHLIGPPERALLAPTERSALR